MCPACFLTEVIVILGAASSGTLGMFLVSTVRSRLHARPASLQPQLTTINPSKTKSRRNDDNPKC